MKKFSELELPLPRWAIVALVCTFCFFQSATQTGFIPSSIEVLQTSFNLTSSQTGSLVSAYDFATMLVVAPVGYYCVPNAPRFLGLGMAVMGASVICFTLANLVPVGQESSSPTAFAILMSSQILFGLGASPLYVLVPVYFAANLNSHLLNLVLGLFYGTSALGPAAGFILGGLAVSHWHWWAALLIVGCLTVLLSIGQFVCPREFKRPGDQTLGYEDLMIPGTQAGNDDAERIMEVTDDQVPLFLEATSSSGETLMKEGSPSGDAAVGQLIFTPPRMLRFIPALVWNSVCICLSEPTFLFNNLAISAQTFCVTALTTFFPLFLSHAFDLESGIASIYLGLTVVPGAAGGIMLGGYITKRISATMGQHIKLTYVSTFMAGLFVPLFLVTDLAPFLILLAPMMALVFIGTVSCNVITMRTVPHHHRGMATAIQSIAYRLLGAVPGPILMGRLFDLACLEWAGSCQSYDIPRLRISWLVFSLVVCGLTGVFFLMQQLTWNRRMARVVASGGR